VLDRLVCGAVLAEADAVVREHVHDAQLHQGRHADGVAAVVGEGQEGAAVGDEPAVQRHAVHDRGHAELAHAVVDMPAAGLPRTHGAAVAEVRQVRSGEVGTAAQQFRHSWRQRLQHVLRCLARGHRVARPCEQRQHVALEVGEVLGQLAAHAAFELGGQRGMLAAVRLEAPAPLGFPGAAPLAPACQRSARAGGTTNGSCGHCSASRVCRISSAPSGSPWARAVPARPGEPLPMVVRQTIRVGRVGICLGLADGFCQSATSCPSTGPITFQP
jgi:hypothetical protein